MKTILITALVLFLVAVAAKSHFAGRNLSEAEFPVPSDAIPQVDVPLNLAQPGEVGPDFKLVLLALLPHGFETTEMQLEAGEYFFIIGNRTGLSEVDVRLDQEGKGRVGEATIGGRRGDWKQRFKLTPGNYILSAEGTPDWSCHIVVRP